MIRKTSFWSALLFIALAPLAARAAEGFDFKFADDWYLDVQHHSKQVIAMLGNNTESGTDIRMVLKVHVVKADASGAELEHTVLVIEDATKTPGKPDDKGIFKGLAGQKFTVKLKPHNDAIEVEAADALAGLVFGDEIKNAPAAQKMTSPGRFPSGKQTKGTQGRPASTHSSARAGSAGTRKVRRPHSPRATFP